MRMRRDLVVMALALSCTTSCASCTDGTIDDDGDTTRVEEDARPPGPSRPGDDLGDRTRSNNAPGRTLDMAGADMPRVDAEMGPTIVPGDMPSPDAGSSPGDMDDMGALAQDMALDSAADADDMPAVVYDIQTWRISESASSGTPDSYFFDVLPGSPFYAAITGGGGGSWGVYVSNGTSAGTYCMDVPTCSITVPAGEPTLIVTAWTNDIGRYDLEVRYAGAGLRR